MADEPPLSDAIERLEPQEVAYRALHAEREMLERELVLARQRQQFGSNAADIDSARLTEESLLRDLDRLLTMIRAAEIRRKPGAAARRWQ